MSVLSLAFLQDLFEEHFPDVDIEHFECEPGASPGDNLIAIVHRILITGTRKPKQEPWENTIIYKQLPSLLRSPVFKDMSQNEAAFYNKVWPVLDNFQNQWEIKHPFQSVPKCYLAQADCILLQDLKREGFVMADRRQGLTLQQSYLALKHLAHFHALSLCMKYQNPEGFHKLLKDEDSVNEVLFRSDNFELNKTAMKQITETVKSCVEHELSGSEDREIYLDKFREFCEVERLHNTMVELVGPKEPLSVICHGDCWTNNLMFKYVDDEVVDLRMVDYQLVRYTSLAIDLIYILYLGVERELRIEHFDALLKHYREELGKRVVEIISGEDSPIDMKLDAANFDKLLRDEIRRCLPYGLGIALNLFPIMTMSSEEAIDTHKQQSDYAVLESGQTPSDPVMPLTANTECKRKMTQLVMDLVDDGIL